MNPDSITDWLNNFSEKHHLPHIHPHAFRHTAASTMIAMAKARAAEVRGGVFAGRT